MVASGEFRPNLSQWLLSVFLSSGFGSLAADGVSYVVQESSRRKAELKILDQQCRYAPNTSKPLICEYYLENTGDFPTQITKAMLTDPAGNSRSWPLFYTTAPLRQWNETTDLSVRTALSSVAIAEPHSLFMIGLPLKQLGDGDKEVGAGRLCFLRRNVVLACTSMGTYFQEYDQSEKEQAVPSKPLPETVTPFPLPSPSATPSPPISPYPLKPLNPSLWP